MNKNELNYIRDFSVMSEVSISNIKPNGWLKEFLKLQESGLTGHLENAGYPFNTIGWNNYLSAGIDTGNTPHWWPFEQTGYWVDGMERCGQLLNSKFLLKKSAQSIENALNNISSDGFIGPEFLKENTQNNKWPSVVFFRALMSRYSAKGDSDILEKITAHYLNTNLDFSNDRDVINVEIMALVYLKTGNQKLLNKAIETYRQYNEKCVSDSCDSVANSSKKPYEHGVTYNEYSKLGALLYICTGDKKYIVTSVSAYRKIDKYFMLSSGLHCSNEYLRGKDPLQSHETCNVSDYTWSLGYLLMATGDGRYADKIEKCVFNAGFGSVTEDFKALQYFSCPNQLIVDANSNHNAYNRGSKWMSYRPNPGTECCPANVNRFFPNYCARMWMKKDDCVFAVLYGESVYIDDYIKIIQKTGYPFDNHILFQFCLKKTKKISFGFRIPSWCKKPEILINGVKNKIYVQNQFAYIKVNSEISTLELVFPSEIIISKYGRRGCVVSKGPLVYSLGMYGRREIDQTEERSTQDFPAYNIYADSTWNYALTSDNSNDYHFVKHSEFCNKPWDIRHSPFSIKTTARRVNGWELKTSKTVKGFTNEDGFKHVCNFTHNGNFTFTPSLPTQNELSHAYLSEPEEIELFPLGMSKIRLTVFPRLF